MLGAFGNFNRLKSRHDRTAGKTGDQRINCSADWNQRFLFGKNGIVIKLDDANINPFGNANIQTAAECHCKTVTFDFPIAADQTISHPYTVAYQTQLLQIKKGEKVLEIGNALFS